MAVRLRLRRMGKKKQPFYRIVAIDSRKARNAKYLENLGYYNPMPEPLDLAVKTDRALYWLQQGAQPSDTVRSLLRRAGIMLRFDLLQRGKSEEEIETELKKWQQLQDERAKRLEAAKIQAASRAQKPEKSEATDSGEAAEAKKAAEPKQAAETPEPAEAAGSTEDETSSAEG